MDDTSSNSNTICRTIPPKTNTKTKSMRCMVCNKKLGMMIFYCRCSTIDPYCITHMRPEEHNCRFDFKADAKDKLKSVLPKVEPVKLVKI